MQYIPQCKKQNHINTKLMNKRTILKIRNKLSNVQNERSIDISKMQKKNDMSLNLNRVQKSNINKIQKYEVKLVRQQKNVMFKYKDEQKNNYKDVKMKTEMRQIVNEKENKMNGCSNESQNNIQKKMRDLENRFNEVLLNKLRLIRNKGKKDEYNVKQINNELQLILERLMRCKIQNLNISQKQYLLDTKIYIIQKILASNTIEQQLIQKLFSIFINSNHKSHYNHPNHSYNHSIIQLLHSIQKQNQKSYHLKTVTNQTTNQIMFTKPKSNQYLHKSKSSPKYIINMIPTPKSIYQQTYFQHHITSNNETKLQQSIPKTKGFFSGIKTTYSATFNDKGTKSMVIENIQSKKDKFKFPQMRYTFQDNKFDTKIIKQMANLQNQYDKLRQTTSTFIDNQKYDSHFISTQRQSFGQKRNTQLNKKNRVCENKEERLSNLKNLFRKMILNNKQI